MSFKLRQKAYRLKFIYVIKQRGLLRRNELNPKQKFFTYFSVDFIEPSAVNMNRAICRRRDIQKHVTQVAISPWNLRFSLW